MPYIRTVLRDISPDELGITYSHEHLISSPPRHYRLWEPDLVLDSAALAVEEVAKFKELGGRALIDATAIDYGRNVRGVAEVAERSGINVVVTSGFNKAAYFGPDIESATLEDLQAKVYADVTDGIDGTGCRAGMLKFGTSYNYMTPAEVRAARAVCRVQKETGLPLYTHTELGTLGLEQLFLIAEEKVEPSRVCIGHLDRNPDYWYIEQIAKSGAFIGIDQISKIKYHTEETRIQLIMRLVKDGYQRRILISGDLARRSYLTAYGGGPGLGYILGSFIPRLKREMLEEGFGVQTVEEVSCNLLIDNPRDFLTCWG